MSLWGSIKSAFKKVVRAVKSVVRQIVRVVVELVNRLTFGVLDLLFGFFAWPPKKLRLHIFILSDESGVPLMPAGDLTPSIDFAKKTLKDRFNVKIVAYSKSFVETITEAAPTSALDPHCDGAGAWGDEFGEAGDFYAKHLAGWNAIPITVTFPITVFVVRDISGKEGCSIGPLSDYITLDKDGVKSTNTMAHEIGHCCGLWHSGAKSNLMWPDDSRGNDVHWWQKNLFRSSRHIQYW